MRKQSISRSSPLVKTLAALTFSAAMATPALADKSVSITACFMPMYSIALIVNENGKKHFVTAMSDGPAYFDRKLIKHWAEQKYGVKDPSIRHSHSFCSQLQSH